MQDEDGFVASPLHVGSQMVGQLDTKRGFSGNIKAWDSHNKSSLTRTTGLILVEIKPIRYELKITQIAQQNQSKIARIQNIVKSQIMNKGSSNIKFTVKKTIKWGHINGVLKGLPVTVGNIHVVWGLKTSKVAHKVKCKKECYNVIFSSLKRKKSMFIARNPLILQSKPTLSTWKDLTMLNYCQFTEMAESKEIM